MRSAKKNKILILGAGTWQMPWLVKSKDLGFTVYATDWSAEAQGRSLPHYFSPIDLRDKKATLAYAQENKIDAIFTSAEVGVQTAAYVAAQMGLPYHSEALAFCATHKFAMREKARMIGLNVPEYQLVHTLTEARQAAAKLGFPLVIKPVDSFSSKGVKVIHDMDELDRVFPKSMACSSEGELLLEEFMVGEEGSVEVLIQNGTSYIMGISKKQKSPLPYRYDLLLEYPGDFKASQHQLIERFVSKLVSGFEIKNGIIHVEIMIGPTEVKLIEFAVRGCGSKVTTHLMPALNSYDVMAYLLWAAFDVQKPIKLSKEHCGLLKFIMLPQGKIKRISGIEAIRAMPGVLDFDIERQSGDVIGEIEDGRCRPGYLLAYSKSKQVLNRTVERALETMEVEY